MTEKYKKNGVKYEDYAPSVGIAVKHMLGMAKKENAFCYTFANGTPLMVEPEMSYEDAIQRYHDVRDGKIKIAVYDTRNDFSSDDVAKGMEKMAKDNDFVISTVNGTTFRIKKDMTARDALNTIEDIRNEEFLRYQKEKRGKNYSSELNEIIQNEVFEPKDEELWKSLNSNRIVGRNMEEVEVYGRVMSHLMKEQKTDKPNAEMLEETLNIVRAHTKWSVPKSNDNLIVTYLLATWKHGEELAHSMKNGERKLDYGIKQVEQYREEPSISQSYGRGGQGE